MRKSQILSLYPIQVNTSLLFRLCFLFWLSNSFNNWLVKVIRLFQQYWPYFCLTIKYFLLITSSKNVIRANTVLSYGFFLGGGGWLPLQAKCWRFVWTTYTNQQMNFVLWEALDSSDHSCRPLSVVLLKKNCFTPCQSGQTISGLDLSLSNLWFHRGSYLFL